MIVVSLVVIIARVAVISLDCAKNAFLDTGSKKTRLTAETVIIRLDLLEAKQSSATKNAIQTRD